MVDAEGHHQQAAAALLALSFCTSKALQVDNACRWEIISSVPGISLLLRKFAPHDTYTVWKQVCLAHPSLFAGFK